MEQRYDFWRRLRRRIHLRLIVPLDRSVHPPEHTARGVMIGLFWAMTPLVGIQMPLVFATWLLVRWKPSLNFGLIVALAWTWVTNVFTMLPFYYVFYLTGVLFLGQLDELSGYRDFVRVWEAALAGEEGVFGHFFAFVESVAHQQGLPMAVGCLPYAFGSAWLGYRWSLRYVIRRRAKTGRPARDINNNRNSKLWA